MWSMHMWCFRLTLLQITFCTLPYQLVIEAGGRVKYTSKATWYIIWHWMQYWEGYDQSKPSTHWLFHFLTHFKCSDNQFSEISLKVKDLKASSNSGPVFFMHMFTAGGASLITTQGSIWDGVCQMGRVMRGRGPSSQSWFQLCDMLPNSIDCLRWVTKRNMRTGFHFPKLVCQISLDFFFNEWVPADFGLC